VSQLSRAVDLQYRLDTATGGGRGEGSYRGEQSAVEATEAKNNRRSGRPQLKMESAKKKKNGEEKDPL